MNKEMARHIVQIATSFDINITRLHASAEIVQNPEMRKRIKDCADTIMGILNRDVILPLVNSYPDIDPDRISSSL